MTDRFDADIAAIGRLDVVPKILDVICRSTGMGFAAVARVTNDRWIACAVRDDIAFGLKPGGELEVRTTICDEIRDSGQAVIIDEVRADPAFRDHHTPRQYGFQSYISVPIRAQGRFFGTLCAIDPKPAKLNTPEIIGMFELFAELIGAHLEAEAALSSERETAVLREQFVAVLGHDLRNPLAAIGAGAHMLRKTPLNAKAEAIVATMQQSVARMSVLIDNVLDFARARMGGASALNMRMNPNLSADLQQVVDEMRTVRPDRTIETEFSINQAVSGDAARIARLLSNLLANALTHGADAPIVVRGVMSAGELVISVSNAGRPIPAAFAEKLFSPFERGAESSTSEGLGLGLFIAKQIAEAHAGTLLFTSDESRTVFTFRMPVV